MRINDILNEFVTPQAVAQDPALEREKDVDVIFYGFMPKDFTADTVWEALEAVLPREYPPGRNEPGTPISNAQRVTQAIINDGGAVVTNKPLSIAKKLVKTFQTYGIKCRIDTNESVAEGSEELYGLKVGDTVKATVRGVKVQGDVIDIFPETQQVELLLRGANAGKTVTIDVQDTESLSEQGMAEGDLNEFAPDGRDPGGDDDSGEDPYGRPEPKHYARSVDYFGRFEADHFDQEDMDDATGVFKGYWDYDGDMKQIAYFKFDDPARTGSDDPGMGWYYEPQNESVAEGIDDEDYGPELDALKKEFGKFTTHYDRMDQDPAYAAQWRKQNTDRLNQQGPDDEDMMGDIGDEMGQDDEDIMREGKPKEKEADYGADYQDMVARVKKLAGMGPLRTVYDPQKRVYKNVPTAVQPKKEQR